MIDEIIYSLKNLMHRKMRSWLTVLSILIGVMAIYAIVSFGLGIQNYMDVIAEEMGTNQIYIQPKGTGAPGLDETFFISKDEVDFVSKINGVDEITPWYFNVAKVEYKKQIKYYFVAGIDPEVPTDYMDNLFTVTIMKGRHLKKGDVNKVALGHNYLVENRIFEKPLNVGDKVEINGEKFEVIGFYEEIGNPADDANIYTTFDGYESLFPDRKDKFAVVMMTAAPGVEPGKLSDKIKEKLRKYRGEDKGKETFSIQTFEDALEMFGTVIQILNGILVLIALISLFVASVNIMNTMYTAVLERTKEIGVMKSIGAKNSNILFIFIFESGFLGAVGGTIGVGVGYLIASAGGAFAAASGYSFLYPIFPWYLTAGCIAFAFFVGTIAGILPAMQAANLKPVDALRYE